MSAVMKVAGHASKYWKGLSMITKVSRLQELRMQQRNLYALWLSAFLKGLSLQLVALR